MALLKWAETETQPIANYSLSDARGRPYTRPEVFSHHVWSLLRSNLAGLVVIGSVESLQHVD